VNAAIDEAPEQLLDFSTAYQRLALPADNVAFSS
jgi:hypothetical protein